MVSDAPWTLHGQQGGRFLSVVVRGLACRDSFDAFAEPLEPILKPELGRKHLFIHVHSGSVALFCLM